MRYVQQRVESFVLRTASGSIPKQWRGRNTVSDPDSCEIVELSLGGAAILMPKNLLLSSNELRLCMPAPQGSGIPPYPAGVDLSITARVRWTDAYYSISRKKVGLQFLKYGDSDKRSLREYVEWFGDCENSALPCALQL
jgi:c-di-GMP-binding flagellar brake protein YcgR